MFDKWRFGDWRYLGYTELYLTGDESEKTVNVVSFYVRDRAEKIRKAEISPFRYDWHEWPYYNTEIVPWLQGGDMWKPIDHPIAVKGTLINHLTKQPPQTP